MLEVLVIIVLFVGIGVAMHMDAAPKSVRVEQPATASTSSEDKPAATSAS